MDKVQQDVKNVGRRICVFSVNCKKILHLVLVFRKVRNKPLDIGEFVSLILRSTYKLFLNPSNQPALRITADKIHLQKGDLVSLSCEQNFPLKQSLVEDPCHPLLSYFPCLTLALPLTIKTKIKFIYTYPHPGTGPYSKSRWLISLL